MSVKRACAGVVVLVLVCVACAGSNGSEDSMVDDPAVFVLDETVPDETVLDETDDELFERESTTSLATPDTSSSDTSSSDTVAPETSAPDSVVKDVVTRAAGVEGDGVQPAGVDSTMARVTSADGEVCDVCLWLATDDASRQRGLMGVTDLGEAVGMAFVWDQPRTGNFFMFQTPTPLSIAWFDAAGDHVGQADMEPCLVENSAICERYTADSPYVLAVEMFGGQLGAIGIAPGSSVALLDLPCA